MTARWQSESAARITASCPDAESLAVYLEGGMDEDARAAIESHLAVCDDCLFVLAEAAREQDALHDSKKKPGEPARSVPQRLRWLTVIAAAAVLLAVVVPSRLNRSQAPPLDVAVEHFEAERGPYRTFEARLSGDSTYRAMQPRSRSVAEPSAGSDVERLRQAAQDLAAAAGGAEDRSASRSALVTLHLRLGNVRAAVELLEPLAGRQPGVDRQRQPAQALVVVALVDDGPQQVGLGADVVVQGGDVEVAGGGELAHGHALDAVGGDEVERGGQDPLPLARRRRHRHPGTLSIKRLIG